MKYAAMTAAATVLLALSACSASSDVKKAPSASPSPSATATAKPRAIDQFQETAQGVNALVVGISRDGRDKYKDVRWDTIVHDLPGLYPGVTAKWDEKASVLSFSQGQCRAGFEFEPTAMATPSMATMLECDNEEPLSLSLADTSNLAAMEVQALSGASEAKYKDLDWAEALSRARSVAGPNYTVEKAKTVTGLVVRKGECEALLEFDPGESGTRPKKTTHRNC